MEIISLITIEEVVKQFSDFADKLIPTSIVPILVQLCATGVLFLLIAKFVFKPIRNILKQRQDYVASQIQNAEDLKAQSIKLEKNAQESIEEAKIKSKEIINNANIEAQKIKEKLLEDTHNEIEKEHLKALEEIEREKYNAIDEMRQEIIDVAFNASEAILNREIDKEDNKRLIEDFVKDINK